MNATPSFYTLTNFNTKGTIFIKPITKENIEKLINAGFLRNTHRGYIDKKGNHVGYCRTKGSAKKRWIQDWYADKAEKL